MAYQALYRKWRPRRFSDVVGQEHITETLKTQVAAGRLSHAYLFTGTRGTGKTSCAKILAKAVNCEAPLDGDPCNACPSCLGIEDGSILDVLELDAASNNGVDQVRALRDEAVYTPAAVKKRVYIIDEVHMLSTPAFNALLKILEEPPAHLMFILATTELHKVPATIKSRCQQFAFRRIRLEDIAAQLDTVAKAEGLVLERDAALLLARLADGGLRDALSLLDQCVGTGERLDEARVLEVLGLAGERETAALAGQIAKGDVAAALASVDRLYQGGKDMSALLGELALLVRDLLLFRTTKASAALLSGGYSETFLERLCADFTEEELLQMLGILQQASAELVYSSHRRSDVELCILRLCRRTLAADPGALLARISRLEAALAGGRLGGAEAGGKPDALRPAPPEAERAVPAEEMAATPAGELPPWDLPLEEETAPTAPPARRDTRAEAQNKQTQERAPAAAEAVIESSTPPKQAMAGNAFWQELVTALKEKLPPSAYSVLRKAELVSGVLEQDTLTLYLADEMSRSRLDRDAVLEIITAEASARQGSPLKLALTIAQPPAQRTDRMGELLEKGRKNSGIISII